MQEHFANEKLMGYNCNLRFPSKYLSGLIKCKTKIAQNFNEPNQAIFTSLPAFISKLFTLLTQACNYAPKILYGKGVRKN